EPAARRAGQRIATAQPDRTATVHPAYGPPAARYPAGTCPAPRGRRTALATRRDVRDGPTGALPRPAGRPRRRGATWPGDNPGATGRAPHRAAAGRFTRGRREARSHPWLSAEAGPA